LPVRWQSLRRTGNPLDTNAWEWTCGFYFGLGAREINFGTAATFDHMLDGPPAQISTPTGLSSERSGCRRNCLVVGHNACAAHRLIFRACGSTLTPVELSPRFQAIRHLFRACLPICSDAAKFPGERAAMNEQKYQKSLIATEQLRTAIMLFLTGGDPSSVITLAGAASTILERLLRNDGKTAPFIDFARNMATVSGAPTPARSKFSRHVNDTLGINDHKHMSPDLPDTLEIDLAKSAEDAVAKAIADYVPLYGQNHDFIKAFLQWAWVNRNGPQVMEEYKKLPEKAKRR
jgi:hypothetical protein